MEKKSRIQKVTDRTLDTTTEALTNFLVSAIQQIFYGLTQEAVEWIDNLFRKVKERLGNLNTEAKELKGEEGLKALNKEIEIWDKAGALGMEEYRTSVLIVMKRLDYSEEKIQDFLSQVDETCHFKS